MDSDPEPDPDPAIFVINLQDANKKLLKFFAYYFWRYIYIIFKDKKSKRSHKAVGIKFILLFLPDDRRIQEAKKHVDPVDPDPQQISDMDHHVSKNFILKRKTNVIISATTKLICTWKPEYL